MSLELAVCMSACMAACMLGVDFLINLVLHGKIPKASATIVFSLHMRHFKTLPTIRNSLKPPYKFLWELTMANLQSTSRELMSVLQQRWKFPLHDYMYSLSLSPSLY